MNKMLFGLLPFTMVFVCIFGGVIANLAPASAAELVYFGSSACSVCEAWDREVGEIYAKTEEAQILPLRHQDVHDPKPQDLAFIKGVIYTPTFVAVEDAKEVGRIVGYMGDFFFWEQVGGLLKKLKTAPSRQVTACTPESDLQARTPC